MSEREAQRRFGGIFEHIYVTRDGETVCRHCGETYRASDEDVIKFNVRKSSAWMEKHRNCPNRLSRN